MITRNANSRTARLYRWYYDLYSEKQMPQSLCPYFWKLALMWLTILPLTLITIPFQIATWFDREDWKTRIAVSIGMYFGLFVFFLMGSTIGSLFITYAHHGTMEMFAVIGFLAWLIAILVGFVQLIRFIANRLRKTYKLGGTYKEPKTSLLVEFVKAKYNKYCPKIDWK